MSGRLELSGQSYSAMFNLAVEQYTVAVNSLRTGELSTPTVAVRLLGETLELLLRTVFERCHEVCPETHNIAYLIAAINTQCTVLPRDLYNSVCSAGVYFGDALSELRWAHCELAELKSIQEVALAAYDLVAYLSDLYGVCSDIDRPDIAFR